MRARRPRLAFLLLGLVLGLFSALTLILTLTSCSSGKVSSQDYKELVLKVLQGEGLDEDRPPLPGLIPSIKKLFDSLYCAEYACVYPSEMDYAAMMAEMGLYEVVAYKARICDDKRVNPPKELQSAHQEICKLLKGIKDDIDAIKLTASLAARVFSQSRDDPITLERASRSYSAKIMERKGMIIEALRQLREIGWLGPAFEGAESEIPELGIENRIGG